MSTPLTGEPPVQVRGAVELEPTRYGLILHRLSALARDQMPDDLVRNCELQPSGVRLAFRTSARFIELDVRALRTKVVGRPTPPGGLYDMVVEGDYVGHAIAPASEFQELDPVARTISARRGDKLSTVAFPPLRTGEKAVEIWLPFAEVTRLVALRTDAPVTPPVPSDASFRWVHHGSSISHGVGAESPLGTWPVVAARSLGWDLVNLGFSGNAVLDPFVARTIRDEPADLITLKLGINVVNLDCFRLRSFAPAVDGFLDTIRDGHPQTPILVISPIMCPIVEGCPGPTSLDPASLSEIPLFRSTGRPEEMLDGKLTVTSIRRVLAQIVARRASQDPNLTYLDGRELYGATAERLMPLPDNLHPSALAHQHIGELFAGLCSSGTLLAFPSDPGPGRGGNSADGRSVSSAPRSH